MRKVQRAALKLLIYAFALVLPLGLALQLSYRTLFGTEDSPSMLVVLFTDPKRFHRWLQEDLRRVAAITVMAVPVVLLIIAIVMLCSGWRWIDKGKRMLIIAAIVMIPCVWVSYVLCSHCPPLSFNQSCKLLHSTEDASKPSVTVRCHLTDAVESFNVPAFPAREEMRLCKLTNSKTRRTQHSRC